MHAAPLNLGVVVWSLFQTRGGLERVGCDFAEAMLQRGHAVSILYKKPFSPFARPQYPVPKGATLIGLPLRDDSRSFERVRQGIAAANLDALVVMFAWCDLMWFPFLVRGTNTRLVMSEHTAPQCFGYRWTPEERLACLRTADRVHVLLDSFVPAFPPDIRNRITVIPNPAPAGLAAPVDPVAIRDDKPSSAGRTLLGVGRLADDIKQFSLLIRAFASLHARFPDWKLKICGEGPSKKEYETLIAELDMADSVILAGKVTDMDAEYAAADLFCIPSRLEGFGMVTIEAHSHELPAVGFAGCPGTSDIIRHGENGLLASDMTWQSLAESLAQLMENPELRRTMGKNGKAALHRFDKARVYDAWEAMLRDVVNDASPIRVDDPALMDSQSPASTESVREYLQRRHPFDRRAAMQHGEEAQERGEPATLTKEHARRFRKRHAKLALPGCGTPKYIVRQWLYALWQRFFRSGVSVSRF